MKKYYTVLILVTLFITTPPRLTSLGNKYCYTYNIAFVHNLQVIRIKSLL